MWADSLEDLIALLLKLDISILFILESYLPYKLRNPEFDFQLLGVSSTEFVSCAFIPVSRNLFSILNAAVAKSNHRSGCGQSRSNHKPTLSQLHLIS